MIPRIRRTATQMLALLILLQTAAVGLQAQATKVTIEGVVVRADNSQPLAGVQLTISRLAVNPQGNLTRVEVAPRGAQVPTNVLSGADGKFVFTNLDPAMYRVIATVNGYVRQEYGQRSIAAGLGSAPLIDLTSGQPLKNAVIRMTATGSIHGRILDEGGQPVIGVPTYAVQYAYDASGRRTFRQAATATTDDRGEYRVFGLAPGRYVVGAGHRAGPVPTTGRGRSNLPPAPVYTFAYFPGVSDARNATPLDVKAGGEASADMRATRAQLRTIRGKVLDLIGGSSAISITLIYPEFSGLTRIDGCACIDATRSYDPATKTFEIQNVIPGEYLLRAAKPDTAPPAPAPNQTGVLALIANTFRPTIGSNDTVVSIGDTDVESVAITFATPVTVPGKLTVEGQPQSAGSAVSFQYWLSPDESPDRITSARSVRVGPDGIFRTQPPMQSGEYLVNVLNIPATHYLKAVRFNGKDLAGNTWAFSGAIHEGFEFVLSPRGGQVAGVATDATMSPVAGVQAVLIPLMNRSRSDLYKTSSTDHDGRFTITGVAPGDYTLFVWDGLEPFRYFDPDFLKGYEAKGKTIHVGESANVVAEVQVIAIPN